MAEMLESAVNSCSLTMISGRDRAGRLSAASSTLGKTPDPDHHEIRGQMRPSLRLTPAMLAPSALDAGGLHAEMDTEYPPRYARA